MTGKQQPESPASEARADDFTEDNLFFCQGSREQDWPGPGFFLGSYAGGGGCGRAKQTEEKVNQNEDYVCFFATKKVLVGAIGINKHKDENGQNSR